MPNATSFNARLLTALCTAVAVLCLGTLARQAGGGANIAIAALGSVAVGLAAYFAARTNTRAAGQHTGTGA